MLDADFNTNGHIQWYFFSVANTRKDIEYTFKIINLLKPDSLYNLGMKPLFYSETHAKNNNVGWYRGGTDICYYTNAVKRKNGSYFQSLVFNVKFKCMLLLIQMTTILFTLLIVTLILILDCKSI